MFQILPQLWRSEGAKEPLPVRVESSPLPILGSAAISALDLLVNMGLVTVLVAGEPVAQEE